ncbi:MAG: TonB family protein [Rubricoccaceae bacterium]
MADILRLLSGAGDAALTSLWLPLGAWALLTVLTEAGLRWRRPHAALRLPIRRAVVWTLPLALALPPLLHALWPPAPVVVSLPPPDLSAPVPFVAAPAPPPLASVPWAALASGLGLVLLTLVALREWARLAKALGALARVVPQTLAQRRAAARLRRTYAVPQRVGLRVSARAAVPYAYGVRRPTVVVPESLLGQPEALRLALRHELAHITRGDFGRALAERVVLAPLAPWLPPVRLLLAGLALDRECLCDAEVLRARPAARADYARLLLAFADTPTPRLALSVAAPPLHQRLDAMQRYPEVPRSASITGLALGALVLVATAGLALAAPGPDPDVVVVPERAALPPPVASATPTALVPVEAVPATPAADPVTGRIVHADTREPIAAANVQVIGIEARAVTGPDGSFTLQAPDRDLSLRVTAPGFATRLVVLAQGQRRLDIGLVPMPELPAEVRERMEETLREAQRRAQEAGENAQAGADGVFEVVEQAPRLIGGIEGLQASIRYPEEARAAGVQGTVFVQFVVDPTGTTTQVTVVRSPNELLSAEAARAVSELRFEPGRHRGSPVPVRFTLPVRFALPTE